MPRMLARMQSPTLAKCMLLPAILTMAASDRLLVSMGSTRAAAAPNPTTGSPAAAISSLPKSQR